MITFLHKLAKKNKNLSFKIEGDISLRVYREEKQRKESRKNLLNLLKKGVKVDS